MSDTITISIGRIGQFALTIPEASDLQRQLDHKLGRRFAADAQYVVEPRWVEGEHERPSAAPETQARIDEADRQMKLDLEPPAPPAPAVNHFDMSTQLFHD